MIDLLFFVNTVGSVAGTVVSRGWMVASLGLTGSLVTTVALNL